MLDALQHSRLCAEHFTEDVEQIIEVGIFVGTLYFKLRRPVLKKDAVPTTCNFPMESFKPAIKQTNKKKQRKTKQIIPAEQRANSSIISQVK